MTKGIKVLKGIQVVYDEQTGSLYIYFAKRVRKERVAKTKELDSVVADYDKEGKLLGLEVLGITL